MKDMDHIVPNFLIVGAMKSGTTYLWSYLRQHPDIFMPKLKEPRFFVSKKIASEKDLNHYLHIEVPNTIDNLEDYLIFFLKQMVKRLLERQVLNIFIPISYQFL